MMALRLVNSATSIRRLVRFSSASSVMRKPDAPIKAETREGFAVASWARAGRGYMLIGRLPIDQIAGLANSLERRF